MNLCKAPAWVLTALCPDVYAYPVPGAGMSAGWGDAVPVQAGAEE